MDPLKEKIAAVLNFSPSERRGLFVLILFILFITLLPNWYSAFFAEDYSLELKSIQSSFASVNKGSKKPVVINQKVTKAYAFDPNEIALKDILELGIPAYLARRWINYREAGGRFQKKHDLLKVYGMDSALYTRLEPFVKLKKVKKKKEIKKDKKGEIKHIELNSSDSLGLLALKGIGPVYAGRIVKFRKRLGGFHSKAQLKEVYGISDSLYKCILPFVTLDSTDCRKVNLNDIDLKELRKHPYFRDFNLSRAIINYRGQHYPLESIEELLSIHLINDSIYEKIRPYVSLE